ncbi:serine/threonine-protein kinase haspin [Xyrichtys novacula]|uniref:Serine/threonine-protein kinase haspin n=1 Tax=Xyrichtys novacula TaxID=13765 RepID=A0AAV1ETY6_XYRNO|nr:serine/threonine-protein kinase haspin [Xyrichtys novacula]
MKPIKSTFLRTYGKHSRKLSAWISPNDRKQAFDSTASTDADVSVFEPRGRRVKKTSVSGGRAVRPAKRKAMSCLTETSSDEENSHRPPPPRSKSAHQSKTARSVQTLREKHSVKRQMIAYIQSSFFPLFNHYSSLHVCVPSVSRFVTRRRRAVAAKPKVPLATVSILNSSDDFASGAFASRKRRRGGIPPAFLESAAENSVNAVETVSFATVPFKEISLNESADHSLGSCSRKPIFCSTPSAGPFSKRPCLKPSSAVDQRFSPPSISVSCIDVMSTFQEELYSPGQPTPSQCPAPPTELHSEVKLHSSVREPETSGDFFMEPTRSGLGEEHKRNSKDTNIKNAREPLPSLNLFLTDDSESSSHFVSAAGGLEWLIEALKEKCLTYHCTVQLDRLDLLTMTQLCSQTSYSSCLEQSSSVCQTNEHPLSVHSLQTAYNHVSDETTRGRDDLHSVNGFESPEHAAPLTGNQSTDNSMGCKQSAEQSSSEEGSAEPPASNPHAESSVEFISGTQSLPNNSVQTLSSGDEVEAVKETCRVKRCTVELQKCALSPVSVQQLKDAGLAVDEKPAKTDVNSSESEPDNLTCSEEVTETMMVSVRQSVNSSSTGKSNDTDRDEKTAVLRALLKEECLTDKVIVQTKRLTSTQLKEILQLKGTTLQSDAHVSDSTSDDQRKTEQRFDGSVNQSNEDASAVKKRKKGSSSSEDKIVSDREEVALHGRKKTSRAPKEKKRRSTSADRPGTTRKACVSGLSVSRWKNKDRTHMFGSRTAQMGGNTDVECSINELMSSTKQPKELLSGTMSFTPARENQLNLSSLMADLTADTQTWSRLKAALSVHRKSMVFLTPKSLFLSASDRPVRGELADVSQDLFATPRRTPFSKRLRSQLQSCSSLVVCEDEDLSDAEKVYAECGQSRPLPWEECILRQRMKKCVKIGEGTFGEVFSTINTAGDTVALKIIPLEGSEKVNGEDQKTFGEILHEIIISKELTSLKVKQQNQTTGFIGLNDLHCVQGSYPPDFLKAWDTFDRQKGSENDRPDFFEKDQLFIILEFEFGGRDLENSNGTLASLGVAKSILHQVTAALAVAEQELHFEHRDLHWGNVLVKTTKQKTGSFLLNGAAHSLETKGVLVRIIDYSLSRLEIDDLIVSCDISNDEELFMGQGDYQFDIYRLMRQENGNNWSTYHPHTNVLWLHYLCSKLLAMKYRCTRGRGAKDTREELNRFYGNVLQYRSATDVLQNCSMFQELQRQT